MNRLDRGRSRVVSIDDKKVLSAGNTPVALRGAVHSSSVGGGSQTYTSTGPKGTLDINWDPD